MWFWCQAFSLDLHLNDLFKSSDIKTCQQSLAWCEQHGKPHNLVFLYMWNEGFDHFWEQTSISYGLRIHVLASPTTYRFIFEAEVDSQWSIGDTLPIFKNTVIFLLFKNEITRLFWAGKKWLKINRVDQDTRVCCPPSVASLQVSSQMSHWPDMIDWCQRYWFASPFVFIYLFILQWKIWRSSVVFIDYRRGAVVQKSPLIASLHNWLLYCRVMSLCLLPAFAGMHY